MKDKYFKPTTNINEFKTVDVITTSDLNPDDNVVSGSNPEDWE